MIKENWRVILVTLLTANLFFMALLELQRLTLWRREQEYFALIQQPSTEKFDYLAKELSETKKTQTGLLDHIYKQLDAINTRVSKVEAAVQEVPANVKETRDIRASMNSLQTAVEQMSAAKP